ncbi:MAG: alkylphosphonate utilization protein [Gammaproteobacteria bacterium]|nr:alkylphosphonate utilization protein [Gammaproteobacteria bacterium]NNM10446.1 alkylphosphonate utilization protein [Pseudomonadales bacterium]RZV51381.1 MAG: alkylphosphonate utilization protein [Pseudomonadales bacterium]
MSKLPACPQCSSVFTYQDRGLYVCPECANEWSEAKDAELANNAILDANGNALADGDSVTLIKDLKLKGTSSVLKVGTKVKNIRLVDGDHNIDCKAEGVGAIKLKSCFVKKA